MNSHSAAYLLFAAVVYFFPWIVARARRHPQQLAIGVLNLVAGWTLVGWVVAIVWACINPARPALRDGYQPTDGGYPRPAPPRTGSGVHDRQAFRSAPRRAREPLREAGERWR